MRKTAGSLGVGLLAAIGLVGTALAQPFPIIGVDFDNGEGSPSNWNTVSGSPPVALTDLVLEDGTSTSVTFTLEVGTPFSTAASAATVPSHPNPLDLIGDYYFETTDGVAARFGNLIPGAQYDVWVFGLRGFAMNNRITIEGGGAPVTFDQVGGSGELFVNDSIGDPGSTLADFAVQQTADASGEITFIFDIVPDGSSGWTVAGVAINGDFEPDDPVIPEATPVPALSAWGLAAFVGLMMFAGLGILRRRRLG